VDQRQQTIAASIRRSLGEQLLLMTSFCDRAAEGQLTPFDQGLWRIEYLNTGRATQFVNK